MTFLSIPNENYKILRSLRDLHRLVIGVAPPYNSRYPEEPINLYAIHPPILMGGLLASSVKDICNSAMCASVTGGFPQDDRSWFASANWNDINFKRRVLEAAPVLPRIDGVESRAHRDAVGWNSALENCKDA